MSGSSIGQALVSHALLMRSNSGTTVTAVDKATVLALSSLLALALCLMLVFTPYGHATFPRSTTWVVMYDVRQKIGSSSVVLALAFVPTRVVYTAYRTHGNKQYDAQHTATAPVTCVSQEHTGEAAETASIEGVAPAFAPAFVIRRSVVDFLDFFKQAQGIAHSRTRQARVGNVVHGKH